jgi:hypothetical protein
MFIRVGRMLTLFVTWRCSNEGQVKKRFEVAKSGSGPSVQFSLLVTITTNRSCVELYPFVMVDISSPAF